MPDLCSLGPHCQGWSRKAGIHVYLKEYHKAMDAYNMILKLEVLGVLLKLRPCKLCRLCC